MFQLWALIANPSCWCQNSTNFTLLSVSFMTTRFKILTLLPCWLSLTPGSLQPKSQHPIVKPSILTPFSLHIRHIMTTWSTIIRFVDVCRWSLCQTVYLSYNLQLKYFEIVVMIIIGKKLNKHLHFLWIDSPISLCVTFVSHKLVIVTLECVFLLFEESIKANED